MRAIGRRGETRQGNMTGTKPRRWKPVFATARRKRRNKLVRQELGQGVDHFKTAAALAAQQTGAAVGPKIDAARGRVQPAAVKARDAASSGWESAVATLAPLVAAATESARQAGKDARRAGRDAERAGKDAERSAKQAGRDAKESARKAGRDARKIGRSAAKANEKQAKKLQKKADRALSRERPASRGGRLFRLGLAGVAVGAGAAWALRRRRAQQWDEYDPDRTATGTAQPVGAEDAAFEPAEGLPTTAYGEPGADRLAGGMNEPR
jgi:hypothetical protein